MTDDQKVSLREELVDVCFDHPEWYDSREHVIYRGTGFYSETELRCMLTFLVRVCR